MERQLSTGNSFRTGVDLQRQDSLSPLKGRRCTDILFLLIFLIFQGGAIYLTYYGYENGDVDKLKFGISALDQVCGVSDSTKTRPNQLWCTTGLEASDFKAVCVADCPTSQTDIINLWMDQSSSFQSDLETAFYDPNATIPYTLAHATVGCTYLSTPLFHRCFVDWTSAFSAGNSSDFLGRDAADDWDFSMHLADLEKSWQIILLCGCGGGLVASWIVILFMKYMAGLIVWLSVIGFNLSMVALTLLVAEKADLISVVYGNDGNRYPTGLETQTEKTGEEYMAYMAYVLAGLTILCFIITLFFRKRINLAIGMLKEASAVLRAIPMLVFMPVPMWLFQFVLTIFWISVSLLLYSTGDIANGAIQVDKTMQHMILYMLFHYLWTMFWSDAILLTSSAGAVASWYWVRDKKEVRRPILGALYRTLRFHLGSLAFGSFVLAVVRFIRIIFTYYTRNLKKLAKKYKIFAVLLCLSHYCLWYVEKVLQFLNRNAYIVIACFGEGYCPSCYNAMKLIAGNAARFVAVSVVTRFVIFISIMMVVSICGIFCLLVLDREEFQPASFDGVSSPFLPLLCTAICAFFVASNFFSTYDMTVDTLFLSFAKDEEDHKQDGRFYARKRLQKYMAKSFRMGKAGKGDAEVTDL